MGIASTLKAKAAKAKAAKGFLEKNVPIPGHFYVGQTEDDLMAPKSTNPIENSYHPRILAARLASSTDSPSSGPSFEIFVQRSSSHSF